MRSRASVTHRPASPAPTPPVQAASTKSKKQPDPAAPQPSGEAATTTEENA